MFLIFGNLATKDFGKYFVDEIKEISEQIEGFKGQDFAIFCWCYGLNLFPQINMLTSWSSVPQNIDILGGKVFKEVIKLKWGH